MIMFKGCLSYCHEICKRSKAALLKKGFKTILMTIQSISQKLLYKSYSWTKSMQVIYIVPPIASDKYVDFVV